MDSVFDLIFNMFNSVIGWLKEIPVSNDLSLFDFSIAILIMSITALAFVSVVRIGFGSNSDTVDIMKKARKDSDKRFSNDFAKGLNDDFSNMDL